MAFAENIMRGWNAPLPAILSSAILMLPMLALIVIARAAAGMNVAVLSAWNMLLQLFGNFWIAGRRSCKH